MDGPSTPALDAMAMKTAKLISLLMLIMGIGLVLLSIPLLFVGVGFVMLPVGIVVIWWSRYIKKNAARKIAQAKQAYSELGALSNQSKQIL